MKAQVFTVGKVSKAKGVAVAVARIEHLDCEPVEVNVSRRIAQLPTPNAAAMEAVALGVGVALAQGAKIVEVFSPSKNAVRAVDGTGGADYETRHLAHLCGWVIYWKSRAEGGVTFEHRKAADMPEAVALAAAALKRAEAALAPSEPEPLGLF